jgi:hypothetical protein
MDRHHTLQSYIDTDAWNKNPNPLKIKNRTVEGIIKKKGRPSARGSHMSGVWGREKPRQAFPLQNLQRGCFEPTTW